MCDSEQREIARDNYMGDQFQFTIEGHISSILPHSRSSTLSDDVHEAYDMGNLPAG